MRVVGARALLRAVVARALLCVRIALAWGCWVYVCAILACVWHAWCFLLLAISVVHLRGAYAYKCVSFARVSM